MKFALQVTIQESELLLFPNHLTVIDFTKQLEKKMSARCMVLLRNTRGLEETGNLSQEGVNVWATKNLEIQAVPTALLKHKESSTQVAFMKKLMHQSTHTMKHAFRLAHSLLTKLQTATFNASLRLFNQ